MLAFGLTLLLANAMSSPDAREIFLRSRDAVDHLKIPAFIVFTYQDESTFEFKSHRHRLGERLRIAVRTSDGHAFVQTERLANGYRGRIRPVVVGDNAVFPNTGTYRLGDFPTATFGMRHDSERDEFLRERASSPGPGAPTVIGEVRTVAIPYDLTRLADETIDGQPMYHLRLRPIRDPTRYALRELWIDETTFEPRRYLALRSIGRPTRFDYPVLIDTSRIGDYLINTRLTGRFSMQVPQSIGVEGPAIDPYPQESTTDVAFTVSDVSFPHALPDWLFDPSAYGVHSADPLPAQLSAIGIPPTLPVVRSMLFE